MPVYDYECSACREESEKRALIERRHDQVCDVCGAPLTLIIKPTPRYKPFNNYFDIGLGAEITGRNQRRLLMREKGMDFRDHPSKGDTSARIDRLHEKKRLQAQSR